MQNSSYAILCLITALAVSNLASAQSLVNPSEETWEGHSNLTRPSAGHFAAAQVEYGAKSEMGVAVSFGRYRSAFATHARAYDFYPVKLTLSQNTDRQISLSMGKMFRWAEITFDGHLGFYSGLRAQGPEIQVGMGLIPPACLFARVWHDITTGITNPEFGLAISAIFLFSPNRPTEE